LLQEHKKPPVDTSWWLLCLFALIVLVAMRDGLTHGPALVAPVCGLRTSSGITCGNELQYSHGATFEFEVLSFAQRQVSVLYGLSLA
jgi:hypothetical protein